MYILRRPVQDNGYLVQWEALTSQRHTRTSLLHSRLRLCVSAHVFYSLRLMFTFMQRNMEHDWNRPQNCVLHCSLCLCLIEYTLFFDLYITVSKCKVQPVSPQTHTYSRGFSQTRGHTAGRISLDCDSLTCRGTLTCLQPANKTTAPGEEEKAYMVLSCFIPPACPLHIQVFCSFVRKQVKMCF